MIFLLQCEWFREHLNINFVVKTGPTLARCLLTKKRVPTVWVTWVASDGWHCNALLLKQDPPWLDVWACGNFFGSCQIHSDPPDNILSSMWVILATSYCHFRAHLGWMFEPEDSATEDQKRPSEAGFYAIILDKVIDEVRFVQSHFVFSLHIHDTRLLYASISFFVSQDFVNSLTLGARIDRNPAQWGVQGKVWSVYRDFLFTSSTFCPVLEFVHLLFVMFF